MEKFGLFEAEEVEEIVEENNSELVSSETASSALAWACCAFAPAAAAGFGF